MPRNKTTAKQPVKWCDLRCDAAEFARLEALDGSCHTFQSLWCRSLKKHVTKNAPCEVLYGKKQPTGHSKTGRST
jgi:hypothetical protein